MIGTTFPNRNNVKPSGSEIMKTVTIPLKNINRHIFCCLICAIVIIAGSCSDAVNTGDHEIPALTTAAITTINPASATSGGNITSDGGATITARGVCWSTGENPTISNDKTSDGTGTGTFTSSIIGLTAGTLYHIRAYATNAAGTGYGNDLTFTTSTTANVTLTTTPVTDITQTSANSGGNITNDGGSPVTVRGVCWSTTANPTTADDKTSNGTGTGAFTGTMSGLEANTTYHVRAYATNTNGTAYGNDVSFTTKKEITGSTVTDVDGNVYPTVTIGTQEWMAENLRTTSYKDGTPIPYVTDSAAWVNDSGGAYTWYNNDAPTYKSVYGALYNWYAVNTAKVCPAGWHMPTDAEWTVLSVYLGGDAAAGGELKETGLQHWEDPNEGATNSSGFTALPGGSRYYKNASFNRIRIDGYWWSATEYASNTDNAWSRKISNFSTYLYQNFDYDKNWGLSIRCVKD